MPAMGGGELFPFEVLGIVGGPFFYAATILPQTMG